MDHADFIHYVRLSEYASAESPSRYRRKVAAFAALGYGWVAACLLCALAVIAWTVPLLIDGRARWALTALLIGAIGLAWSSLKALWIRLDEPPEGIRLTKAEAPALFKILSKVRHKVNGPRLDEVYLDDQFNASITQLPRRGLFGGHVNRLHLGLPLVMGLDPKRLTAVIAHEYGHLRGGHGRFAAWIYQTRQSWTKLNQQLAEDDSLSSMLTGLFMRWYVPRFLAQTFALARQDEYEADRIAGELVGAATAAASLIEIEVKGAWLARQFWRQHWRAASDAPMPLGPFRALRHLLATPPEEGLAQEALRQALKAPGSFEDTHPVLKDRLEALSVPPRLPTWSSHGALAWLGPQAEKWINHFDQQWCRAHASDWKAQHLRLKQTRERVQAWRERIDSLNANELTMLAECEQRLDAQTDVATLHERALRIKPEHPAALIGLVLSRPDAPLEQRLAWLDTLWHTGGNVQLRAARLATHALERRIHDAPPEALKRWRQRMKDAETAAETLWEDLCTPPWLQGLSRHDLNELDLEDAVTLVSRSPAVQRAWLVCKRCDRHPHRQAYLLFVELPTLTDAQRHGLCRRLEQQLDLPGPALALWAGEDPTLKDIERHAFSPIFVRQAERDIKVPKR